MIDFNNASFFKLKKVDDSNFANMIKSMFKVLLVKFEFIVMLMSLKSVK